MEASATAHAGRRGILGRRSPLMRLQKDERLVGMVREGNPGAFEAIVDRYQGRLLGFCRQMLRSNEDAEDVLQEVFVNAYKAMIADRREINLRPWLYRISRNRCLNHLRKPVADARESMDMIPISESASTAETVHNREEFRQLLDDVSKLPETQRTALLLREMDSLSYDEIAETMDTTVPSVKSLLVRARMSLSEGSEARLLTCGEVRLSLAEAAEGIAKVTAPVRRHVRECPECTRFRKQIRSDSKALATIFPAGPLLGLKAFILTKVGGFGGSAAAGGAGSCAAGSATAGACTAGGAAAAGSSAAAAGAAAIGAGGGAMSSAMGAKAVAGVVTAAVITAGAVEVGNKGEQESVAPTEAAVVRSQPPPTPSQSSIGSPATREGRQFLSVPGGAGAASLAALDRSEETQSGGQEVAEEPSTTGESSAASDLKSINPDEARDTDAAVRPPGDAESRASGSTAETGKKGRESADADSGVVTSPAKTSPEEPDATDPSLSAPGDSTTKPSKPRPKKPPKDEDGSATDPGDEDNAEVPADETPPVDEPPASEPPVEEPPASEPPVDAGSPVETGDGQDVDAPPEPAQAE